eukprot:COSAG02_NODE_2156_length_9643_cov_55.052761_2_plen_43_part_00
MIDTRFLPESRPAGRTLGVVGSIGGSSPAGVDVGSRQARLAV